MVRIEVLMFPPDASYETEQDKVRYLDTSGPSMARRSTRPWERRHLLSTDWGQDYTLASINAKPTDWRPSVPEAVARASSPVLPKSGLGHLRVAFAVHDLPFRITPLDFDGAHDGQSICDVSGPLLSQDVVISRVLGNPVERVCHSTGTQSALVVASRTSSESTQYAEAPLECSGNGSNGIQLNGVAQKKI